MSINIVIILAFTAFSWAAPTAASTSGMAVAGSLSFPRSPAEYLGTSTFSQDGKETPNNAIISRAFLQDEVELSKHTVAGRGVFLQNEAEPSKHTIAGRGGFLLNEAEPSKHTTTSDTVNRP